MTALPSSVQKDLNFFESFLTGKKSYIVSVVGLVYAVVIVGWQQHNWVGAAQTVLGAGGLASLRSAVSVATKVLAVS